MAQPAKQVTVYTDPKTGQWEAKFLHTEHPISPIDLPRIIRTMQFAHKKYLLQLRLETRRRMAKQDEARGTSTEE